MLDKKWSNLLEVREEVLKALETQRISDIIGSSLEAKVILYTDRDEFKKILEDNVKILPELFITSQVEISNSLIKDSKKSESLPLWISVKKADGAKCNRCWNYSETVGADGEFGDICSKCVDVVRKEGAKDA